MSVLQSLRLEYDTLGHNINKGTEASWHLLLQVVCCEKDLLRDSRYNRQGRKAKDRRSRDNCLKENMSGNALYWSACQPTCSIPNLCWFRMLE